RPPGGALRRPGPASLARRLLHALAGDRRDRRVLAYRTTRLVGRHAAAERPRDQRRHRRALPVGRDPRTTQAGRRTADRRASSERLDQLWRVERCISGVVITPPEIHLSTGQRAQRARSGSVTRSYG